MNTILSQLQIQKQRAFSFSSESVLSLLKKQKNLEVCFLGRSIGRDLAKAFLLCAKLAELFMMLYISSAPCD